MLLYYEKLTKFKYQKSHNTLLFIVSIFNRGITMSKLTSDLQANLDLFIEETKETQKVWSLYSEADEGWISVESTEFENSEVMPFWSSKEDAEFHNVEEWDDFTVGEIPLDIFTEDWLVTLSEDGILVGVNWNQQLEGKEVEASDLVKLYL